MESGSVTKRMDPGLAYTYCFERSDDADFIRHFDKYPKTTYTLPTSRGISSSRMRDTIKSAAI